MNQERKYMNPFINFKMRDYILWIGSLLIIFVSNLLGNEVDPLTLIAALIGVTSLIFAAKGHVLAQILMVLFSILYGVISYRFRYWGEMITYLGMTMPMAIWSAITWFKNPSKENAGEVAIQSLSWLHKLVTTIAAIIVTIIFYFILAYFHTPNIVFSTLSIATSFVAAALTMLRSSYYALWYAGNDLVLIVLWVLAMQQDVSYLPVVVNFIIFFFNDMYGFMNWKKREKA